MTNVLSIAALTLSIPAPFIAGTVAGTTSPQSESRGPETASLERQAHQAQQLIRRGTRPGVAMRDDFEPAMVYQREQGCQFPKIRATASEG